MSIKSTFLNIEFQEANLAMSDELIRHKFQYVIDLNMIFKKDGSYPILKIAVFDKIDLIFMK